MSNIQHYDTLCPCVFNPINWRYLGEGLEAIVFDFELQVSSNNNNHQPPIHQQQCPREQSSVHTITLNDINNTTITLTPLCAHQIGELVLRIPKVEPQHLATIEKLNSSADHTNSITQQHDPNKKTYEDDLTSYFTFKDNIVRQILPPQVIANEIPILAPAPFIAELYKAHYAARPITRQKEYDMIQAVEQWSTKFGFQQQSSPCLGVDNLGYISLPFLRCLLMQDFTKHRILHHIKNETTHDENQEKARDVCELNKQDENLIEIKAFADLTISYEIKPKWGFTRDATCFESRNGINCCSPQTSNNSKGGNDNNISSSVSNSNLFTSDVLSMLSPQDLDCIEHNLYHNICRSCALRIEREFKKGGCVNMNNFAQTQIHLQHVNENNTDNTTQPNHTFCPLDLFRVADYYPTTINTEYNNNNNNNEKELTIFKQRVKNTVDSAINALFHKAGNNLRCSIYHYDVPEDLYPQQESSSNDQNDDSNNTTTTTQYKTNITNNQNIASSPSITLHRLLTISLLTPPVSHFFHGLRTMQAVLDQHGPNLGHIMQCTCEKTNSSDNSLVENKQSKRLVDSDHTVWANALQKYIQTILMKQNQYHNNNNNNNVNNNANQIATTPLQSTITCAKFLGDIPIDKLLNRHNGTTSNININNNQNKNQQITAQQSNLSIWSCEACLQRMLITTSMTIKDLSMYLTMTPVYLDHTNNINIPNNNNNNTQNTTDNTIQYALLHGEKIPIITPKLIEKYNQYGIDGLLQKQRQDTYPPSSNQDINPHNTLDMNNVLSQYGYFLYPIDQLDLNEANQGQQKDINNQNHCNNNNNNTYLFPSITTTDLKTFKPSYRKAVLFQNYECSQDKQDYKNSSNQQSPLSTNVNPHNNTSPEPELDVITLSMNEQQQQQQQTNPDLPNCFNLTLIPLGLKKSKLSQSNDNSHLQSNAKINYMLYRIQCGDIGPKPVGKYIKWVNAEQNTIATIINLLICASTLKKQDQQ